MIKNIDLNKLIRIKEIKISNQLTYSQQLIDF